MEQNPAPADSSQFISQLTIKGDTCELAQRAEAGAEEQEKVVEMTQPCEVRDNSLVFTEDGTEAEIPFEQTAEGDIRFVTDSGAVLKKQ